MTQQTNQYYKMMCSARDTVDVAIMNATANVPRTDEQVELHDLGGFLRQGFFKHSQHTSDKASLTELDMLNKVVAEINAAKAYLAHVEEGINAHIATLNPANVQSPISNTNGSPREVLIAQLTNTINNHNASTITVSQVANWVGSDASANEIQGYINDFQRQPDKAVTPEDILALNEDCSE